MFLSIPNVTLCVFRRGSCGVVYGRAAEEQGQSEGSSRQRAKMEVMPADWL